MSSSLEVQPVPKKGTLSCSSDLFSGLLWVSVSGTHMRLVLVWVFCKVLGGLPGNSCSDSNQAMGHAVGLTVPLEMQRNPRCVDSVCSAQMYHGEICTAQRNPACLRLGTWRPV